MAHIEYNLGPLRLRQPFSTPMEEDKIDSRAWTVSVTDQRPIIDVRILNLPSTLLSGEICTGSLEITNASSVPCKLLHLGQSQGDVRYDVSPITEAIVSGSASEVDNTLSPRPPFVLTMRTLADGESFSMPVLLHTLKPGCRSVDIVVLFEVRPQTLPDLLKFIDVCISERGFKPAYLFRLSSDQCPRLFALQFCTSLPQD